MSYKKLKYELNVKDRFFSCRYFYMDNLLLFNLASSSLFIYVIVL